ncbi:hypothetical protein [Aeromicrobium endophyticum]|uniref:LGFP repeat-containing protein n=1 Tax=Aeromicrobium endophyticum TaxID=2292704 RepID=A0A371P5B4_9ACTN|nr:hypothetical protein [Aeromicrobium endophyticum]REK70646.1 hypothetical protein DX116_16165 [Aeromicrobium endophyticum]
MRRLLAVALLTGVLSVPVAAQADHDHVATAKKASPVLTVTTRSVTASEARTASVTVRCRSSKTCRGALRVRVGGMDGTPRSYRVKARASARYTLRLTSAQLATVPQGGAARAAVRVRETGPKKVSTRSVTITLRRAAPATPPGPSAPAPTVPVPSEPPVVESRAYREKNWTPTSVDTCPASLHASYSVVGADGKLYPTWHPPTDVDPATGKACTYGHEHGDDPSTSDIYGWTTDFLDADGTSRRGVPFGYVSEALDTYAAGHDHVTRHEDNVGHKIIVANDVKMVAASPREYVRDEAGAPIACDFLIKVHQGSHSGDGLINNAHELLYSARCSDGTEIISSTLTRFGDANQFSRSCDAQKVLTSGSDLPDGFGGRRVIPDRFCVDRDVLVPDGRTSSIWALYEVWESANRIRTPDGTVLASFDPWFGVRNPSRAHAGGFVSSIIAMVDTLWMVDTADGGTAHGYPWDEHAGQHLAKGDPESPFDGAQRDYYLHSTTVDNPTATRIWWTDPYGDGAVTEPAPGMMRQWVSTGGNTDWPELERRTFNLQTDYGNGNGVHAPN